MRLRERDLITVHLKRWMEIEDDEGNSKNGYQTESTPLRLNVQSASGFLNATIYGTKLSYMKDCKYQGDVELYEKDGICLYVDKDAKPDYKITSIQPYSTHLNVKLEKIDANGR